MKILFFLAALANVIVFMWEYRQWAIEQGSQTLQQPGQEQIVLVSELKAKRTPSNEPTTDIDFTSLYPPGLDPLADNLLTEQAVLEHFTGELLFSAEPLNETITPPTQ